MTDKISYEDFAKLDIKVAKILDVEEIPNKDKLYKLSISLGSEKRTIVAGIKQYYKKEELKNKKIIIIANLEPAKIGGIESNGMLLAAGSKEENICVLLAPDKDIKEGMKIS
ncbi:MAG: methionine--tRNA ligase subunit beta [Nanoarchaeota archaeon]